MIPAGQLFAFSVQQCFCTIFVVQYLVCPIPICPWGVAWQAGGQGDEASLGKSRQVRGDEKAIEILEYKLFEAWLGKPRQVCASLVK